MDRTAGDAVHDRYELREELGEGGLATVWRARDAERDREVALKLPSFHAHDRATVRERFDRERRLLEPFAEGLSHGTLVRYLDGTLDVEPRYVALELLDGDPLAAAFGTGSLGSAVRRRIVTDLAETLDFIHRNGVVYLDLKPENVVLRRSGRPVLYDFNTAVRRSESVETRFGADQFKAPELLAGEDVDAAVGAPADVFSWGKLAFYLLTGVKVPTTNVPDGGLDPRDHGARVDDALADVIQRATVPDPEGRPDDGVALAGAVAGATGRAPRAVATHPSGVECAVADGDSIGRLAPDEPVPWVVLADRQGHVAPRHARFSHAGGAWTLEDRSRQGTYVAGDGGWRLALSEAGYRAHLEQGRLDADDPRPPAERPLPVTATVAPVHPEYGIRLRVRTPDG